MAVGAVGADQEQRREWWCKGVDLRRRVDDWAIHTFREHNEEADAWAGREVGGRTEGWEDDSKVTWFEVIGLCGFWELS